MDFTTRLLLNKPDPDPVTGDVVDVQKLNDNADKIDASIGFTICTSTMRPSAPFDGQSILETDTGKTYVWGGSDWLPLLVGNSPYIITNLGIGAAADTNPFRKLYAYSSATNGALSLFLLRQSGSATGSRALSTMGGADTQDHFWFDFDGKMQWGSGTGGGDTTLYRSAADTLRTDDAFSANAYQIDGNTARVQTVMIEASATSNLALVTGSFVDVPGCTVTFTTRKANALLKVLWVSDLDLTAAGGTGLIAHSICNVGGTDQLPNVVYEPGNTTGGRATLSQFHTQTLGAAGSYTVKQRAKMASGASGIQTILGHTRILAEVYE